MKKSILVLLCAIAVSAGLFAYSPKMKITGLVHIYGSAPFTYVGFVTDEGKQYSLMVEDKSDITLDQLSALQGVHLELTGKIIARKEGVEGFQELKDGRFIVTKVDTLKK